jgi:hypothetical protein
LCRASSKKQTRVFALVLKRKENGRIVVGTMRPSGDAD